VEEIKLIREGDSYRLIVDYNYSTYAICLCLKLSEKELYNILSDCHPVIGYRVCFSNIKDAINAKKTLEPYFIMEKLLGG